MGNKFRDSRLGRLVAEFRYNFDKAAAALGQEFEYPSLDAQECRRRYRELVKPRTAGRADGDAEEARRRIKEDAGRAKDGPAPDQQVVNDYSSWWLRRLKNGPSAEEAAAKAERNARSVPKASASSSTASVPTHAGGYKESADDDIAQSWQAHNWSRRYAAENFEAAGAADDSSSMVASFTSHRGLFAGTDHEGGDSVPAKAADSHVFVPPARSQ